MKREVLLVLTLVLLAGSAYGQENLAKKRVTLHGGLDDSAIETAYRWRFKPGLKDGRAVPVRIKIEMSFKLR